MVGRKIRDANEAAALLAAAKDSGVPRAQWAHNNGIDARSLNAWRLNLDKPQKTKPPELSLVELVPSETPTPTHALLVRCGPWTVEVHDNVDQQLLTTVLRAVVSC